MPFWVFWALICAGLWLVAIGNDQEEDAQASFAILCGLIVMQAVKSIFGLPAIMLASTLLWMLVAIIIRNYTIPAMLIFLSGMTYMISYFSYLGGYIINPFYYGSITLIIADAFGVCALLYILGSLSRATIGNILNYIRSRRGGRNLLHMRFYSIYNFRKHRKEK